MDNRGNKDNGILSLSGGAKAFSSLAGTVKDVSPAFMVKLLVVVLVGWLIVTHLDMHGAMKAFTVQTLVAIALMQLVSMATSFFGAYRHAVLVRHPRAPLMPCFVAITLAVGLNLIIPGRFSDLIKATYLRYKLGIPLSNGTAAIVVERLFDVLVVALIGLYGVVGLYTNNIALLYVFLGVSLSGLVLLVPLSKLLLPWIERKKTRFWNFVAGNCRHVLAVVTLRTSTLVLALTVITWGIHYLGVWLFFYVQPGYGLSLLQAAVVFCTIMFAGAVPALPGGIGVVQAAVTLALVKMGIPASEALMLSIALHVAEVLMGAVLAPLILLTQPSGLLDLLKNGRASAASGQGE